MKEKLLIFILLLSTACASVRDIDKPFSDENVARIIKTLSSDTMRGRSALTADIQPATVFIEKEFAKIGLQPMNGLNGFRQEFTKGRIRPDRVQVVADGTSISESDILVISDHQQIDISARIFSIARIMQRLQDLVFRRIPFRPIRSMLIHTTIPSMMSLRRSIS